MKQKFIYRKSKKQVQRIETLLRMWAATSIPLRHFDRDLAQRCLEKSDYWLNPDNYSAPEIVQFRIGIEQVYKDAKKLL